MLSQLLASTWAPPRLPLYFCSLTFNKLPLHLRVLPWILSGEESGILIIDCTRTINKGRQTSIFKTALLKASSIKHDQVTSCQ
jgi:hypothetical protein